jgi:hypothetical protein
MTKQQEINEITSLKEYFRDILSSKENSQRFLVELGTNDKTGKLRKHYDR